MEKLLLWLLVLTGLSGITAQEDLFGHVLIFPKASPTAYIPLGTKNKQSLQSFTVCLRYFSDLTRDYSLFSYASRTSDNEILLFRSFPDVYKIYIGGTAVTFRVPEKEKKWPEWVHICTSWESATGIVQLWVDGKPLPRKGLQKGYSVKAEAVILLGQDQDSYGAGFDENQSFVGEITDVHMWDHVLTPAEIRLIKNNEVLPLHPMDWRNMSYEIKGYVLLKPSLCPVYRAPQATQEEEL
ncbi:serum amyloid P-component-like isoform X1 [Alligator sinensis]|uniref:Pentraxin family member n=1 Tax=Alligator sinensis TaxID=38654 RepID=A0A3Q0H924_ALLSI|nr:serum amyloid P-component-like isoform X1 [Alligator sinensis]XP_025066931.1 serum amyloid P-component-like isoform X1 [Alligator sinensis]XP_025066932.1 serum amyloid P-component-like isoform X1 [Alligator sinensis]